MNDNAKKWVKALRSGEYKQTQMALRDRNGFCCLGVACDLYARENSLDGDISHGSYLSGAFEPVRKWLGLSHATGLYDNGVLVSDNDHGKTFDEIADIIEAEPNGLFKEI